METRPESTSSAPGARRAAYACLLAAAAAIVGWALLRAPAEFSVNDRSRWATVRALVDMGTYAIGRREPRGDPATGGWRYIDLGIVSEPGWDTVDLVLHPSTRRFYSTKPTLLPTLLAGEYWLLRGLFGWEITDQRDAVTHTILFTVNWLPFLFYLGLLARLTERLGGTDWGRLFVFTVACFGTFVSGFLTSLNNHTVAATAVLFTVYQCLCIQLDGDRRWWRFALAGLFAGWAACNELPAAGLAAGVLVWLLRLSPRRTLRIALPALLLPVAAYLYTQYLAFGTLVPTYARIASEWYRFPGSYWLRPIGVDRADEGKLRYAFNLLAGHTGVLSLTPVLLLGWLGMVRTARRALPHQPGDTPLHEVSWLTLGLTVVTLGFYTVGTNNYGGATSGLRWLFWLVPLWLLTMLPEADRWARHRGLRVLALVLLAISIGSAMYALENPWRPSWLFVWLEGRGFIHYP